MTIGGTRWPGPTFRDEYTPAEEAVMEAGQAESEDRDELMARIARLQEALRHIAESAEHPSPTVNTAGYLGRAARAALSEEES